MNKILIIKLQCEVKLLNYQIIKYSNQLTSSLIHIINHSLVVMYICRYKINSLFLDIINDFSLEQFVTFPTRDKNILNLIFSSQPIIPKLSVIPGMSDHEAILFSINSGANICHTKLEHKIFLYHKGNIDCIKDDLINFQNTFMLCDPYSRSVENNWNHFKYLYKLVLSNISPKKCQISV